MTVSTAYTPLTFAGNGATTAFAVSWPFFTGTLVVTLISSTGVETTKTITTHYTVSGGTDSDGLPATGTVTMLTAPAAGETLRITRTTTRTQASTWADNDPFPAKTTEAAFDRLTLIAQEALSGGADGITGDVMQLDSSGAQDFWDGEGNPVRMSFLELTEASAPDTPSSGYGRIYTKTDGDLYHKNDAGTETNLTDSAEEAATSAAAAAASATNASTSATNAANSATAASTSATNAATAETNAETAATNAATSETNAASSATAAAASATAAGFKWNYDTTTTMADPGTGEVRLNNATLASVTAIAISDLTADTGNPDASAFVLTWDDSTNTSLRGTITIRKATAPQNFAVYSVSAASTDNTGWTQLSVTYVTHSGSFSAADPLFVLYARTGDKGSDGIGAGDMLAANNLSDLVNVATARTNLGVAIGTNVQAYDAGLADIAALAVTDGNVIVGNGTNWVAESGATARASLGLTIGTDVQAYDAGLADIAALAVTDGNVIVGNGTNWVAESGATARASLGLTIGTDVQAYDANTAKLNVEDQVLTGGVRVTAKSLTTGSITLDPGDRPKQYISNAGAFTITAPSFDGDGTLSIENVTGAGAVSFSGFSATQTNTGDTIATTVGHKYKVHWDRTNGISTRNVVRVA